MSLFVQCDCGRDPACPECKGDPRGARVECCPLELLTPDVTEFFSMMDYANAGLMPVLAGSRDQAHVFMEAMTFTRTRLAERTGDDGD